MIIGRDLFFLNQIQMKTIIKFQVLLVVRLLIMKKISGVSLVIPMRISIGRKIELLFIKQLHATGLMKLEIHLICQEYINWELQFLLVQQPIIMVHARELHKIRAGFLILSGYSAIIIPKYPDKIAYYHCSIGGCPPDIP